MPAAYPNPKYAHRRHHSEQVRTTHLSLPDLDLHARPRSSSMPHPSSAAAATSLAPSSSPPNFAPSPPQTTPTLLATENQQLRRELRQAQQNNAKLEALVLDLRDAWKSDIEWTHRLSDPKPTVEELVAVHLERSKHEARLEDARQEKKRLFDSVRESIVQYVEETSSYRSSSGIPEYGWSAYEGGYFDEAAQKVLQTIKAACPRLALLLESPGSLSDEESVSPAESVASLQQELDAMGVGDLEGSFEELEL